MMKCNLYYLIVAAILLGIGCGRRDVNEAKLPSLNLKHYAVETETPADVLRSAQADLFRIKGAQDFGASVVVIDNIVNLGERVWKLVTDNKATSNVTTSYANALPDGVSSSQALANFSDLQTRSFRFYGKNKLGQTVYDITYTVVHRYNGDYDGKGKYLENVTVIPSKVSVLWGYTLSIDVVKANAVNVGSSENPVASLALEVVSKVSTILKADETRSIYQFRGDSADFKKL